MALVRLKAKIFERLLLFIKINHSFVNIYLLINFIKNAQYHFQQHCYTRGGRCDKPTKDGGMVLKNIFMILKSRSSKQNGFFSFGTESIV